METDVSASEIQEQMQAIRHGLRPEVDEIVDSARTLMSWQHYVQSFPWASLGVAAAVGYMLVPQKMKITSPDVETLTKLAKDHRLVVESSPKSQSKPGLIASAVTLAGGILLRAGLAYAGQQAQRLFESGRMAQQQTRSPDDQFSAIDDPSAQQNRF